MRVVHIHSGNLYGGVETLLATLAREGGACPALEQQFALCFDGRLSVELRAAGATLHALGEVRVRSLLSVRRARRSLADLLRRERFDAAVCHSPWSQAVFAHALRAARLPLVCWMHAPADGRHWLERWARRTPPDLVVCNSHFTAAAAPRLYPHARVEVVYCPVALTCATAHAREVERAAVRAELETDDSDAVVIQVSRMESLKGHAQHLEALSLLRDVQGWTCWMVGGAQRPVEVAYLDELKRQAARLGVADRVRFAGARADVPRLLASADIYCQPNSNPEGFGLTFVEAMSASLPVVTTDIGGAREIVNDSCGMLLPVGDTPALAEALRRLIESASERETLGARGRQRAQELCDPATQLNRLHNLFDTCLRREVAA
ncbi:MAG: glycosyltransferase [Acidobacteria bacterium]|nr:glycosyltransferase [Acidobacteriota bacterium]